MLSSLVVVFSLNYTADHWWHTSSFTRKTPWLIWSPNYVLYHKKRHNIWWAKCKGLHWQILKQKHDISNDCGSSLKQEKKKSFANNWIGACEQQELPILQRNMLCLFVYIIFLFQVSTSNARLTDQSWFLAEQKSRLRWWCQCTFWFRSVKSSHLVVGDCQH